ncbi:hypothetical protein [Fibrobacter sp.]|uniref:hypothetical protein n=1 Tax=Fibrobacter sp. TaxID=35828 RepID=UPI00388ECBBC
MLRKSVLGFAILAAGLLVWSCGDGSVDSLTDSELLMISRFPSTIDYDMLDSIVEACKKDAACWEKAKKTGEIYKGDYTEVIRDSSGNIVVVEGDSAYVWKDGKKLPVFNFSSNSNDDDDDDVTSSGSTATSGSSSKRSSASGYDVDEYTDGGDGPDSNGSGSGGTSVAHDRSSSSKKSTSSSSVDLSFLNSSSSIKVLSSSTIIRSSSSKKVASSSSVDLSFLSSSSSSLGVASSSSIKNERSSSSKIVINQSSVSQSSSSQQEVHLSSSSITQHGGGGGGTGMTCDEGSLSGSCTVSENPGYRNETVTYTFRPDGNNTCTAYGEVEWNVTNPEDGASVTHWADPTSSSRSSFSFDVKYSSIGDKKSVIFSMGGQNKQCDAVTIKRRCESNTYTCSTALTSATNNMWKNDVTYKWTFSQGASNCLDVSSVNWNGSGLTINGNTATKKYPKGTTTPVNESVSLTVVDELGSHTVNCTPNATAEYVPDVVPSFSVSDMTMPINYATVKVTPTSVAGCSYSEGNKCSYSLEDENGTVVASASGGYVSGALNSFSGESNEVTVNYTLTLTNYIGSSEPKTFSITYVTPEDREATTTFVGYMAGGVYMVSVPSADRPAFKCKLQAGQGNTSYAAGVVNGTTTLTIPNQWNNSNGYPVSTGSSFLFMVNTNVPSGMTCGLDWN